MFERLKVTNYACFKECEVEFRKLTIFIGENASGKSMLINALLQVVDSLFGTYWAFRDLSEVIPRHMRSNEVIYEIELVRDLRQRVHLYTLYTEGLNVRDISISRLPELLWHIEERFSEDLGIPLERLEYTRIFVKSKIDANSFKCSETTYRIPLLDVEVQVLQNGYTVRRISRDEVLWQDKSIKDRGLFLIPDIRMEKVEEMKDRHILALAIALSGCFEFPPIEPIMVPHASIFIPAFRTEPREVVPRHELRQYSAILPISDLYLTQMFYKEDLSELAKSLGFEDLCKMLSHYFDMDDIDKEIQRYGESIKLKLGILYLPLTLVDSGTYYILPIIFECAFLTRSGFMIIEHPELHLNPRLQARLMDFLIDVANAKNAKILIETHSPFMVYRVMRRVAEGKLKNFEVAIYYFKYDKSSGWSNVTEIKLDEYGRPINWPEGFFEEDYEDALAILDLLSKRSR